MEKYLYIPERRSKWYDMLCNTSETHLNAVLTTSYNLNAAKREQEISKIATSPAFGLEPCVRRKLSMPLNSSENGRLMIKE